MNITKSLRMVAVDLRRQPMLSTIQIVATALTIALVMLYLTMMKIHTLPIAPESNRERLLHWTFVLESRTYDYGTERILSQVSEKMYTDCFEKMEYAEATALYSATMYVRAHVANGNDGSTEASRCLSARYCSSGYWKVFDFDFVCGRATTDADAEKEVAGIVISSSSAKQLFGTEEAIGRVLIVNGRQYDVVGVVADVEAIAQIAHSDIWLPHKHCIDMYPAIMQSESATGSFRVVMMAHDKDELELLASEARSNVEQYAQELETIDLDGFNQPYTTFKQSIATGMYEPDEEGTANSYYLVIFIMLLVPAINLSSITHSRLRRRSTEMAVYRTFGATKWFVARELFIENLVVTLLAGLLGFALSIAGTLLLPARFFGIASNYDTFNAADTLYISLSSAIRPELFGYAMLFCLVLNIICCAIPIWHSTRRSIAESFHRQ